MASVHARPLQASEGLDTEGNEDKMDREQSDQFRGVPGHGRFKTEKVQTPNHALPQPWAPSCTDVNLLSLTTGSYESTGSLVPLSVPSASVPACGESVSLSGWLEI